MRKPVQPRQMDIRLTFWDTGAPGPRELPALALVEEVGRHRIEIRSGAWCTFEIQDTNHPHLHRDFSELCIVVEGRGTFSHGAERHALAAGSVFIADPGVLHEIRSPTRDLLLAYFTVRIDRARVAVGRRYEDRVVDRFLAGHRICVDAQDHLIGQLAQLRSRGSAAHAAAWRNHQAM